MSPETYKSAVYRELALLGLAVCHIRKCVVIGYEQGITRGREEKHTR